MRVLLPALLVVFVGGCGRSTAPTLSGGKPVSHWTEALRTSADPKLRKEAAFKLGNVGPTDPSALPALAGALQDREAVVRCEVILALVKFGPAAAEVVPALSDLRDRDPDPRVRDYAAKALEKIQRQ
jgi:HEAT repeat protein